MAKLATQIDWAGSPRTLRSKTVGEMLRKTPEGRGAWFDGMNRMHIHKRSYYT